MNEAVVLRPALTVRIVERYGRETIYPECEVSRGFAVLLKQTTLTREDIENIKRLGYEIRTKPNEGVKL